MKKRYSHYVEFESRHSNRPCRMGYLQVDWDWRDGEEDGPGVSSTQLRGWHLTVWVEDEHGTAEERSWEGPAAEHFWRCAAANASLIGGSTIWCNDAIVALETLEVWDKALMEDISVLCSTAHPLILAGPPTIVTVQTRHCKFTLCDVANHVEVAPDMHWGSSVDLLREMSADSRRLGWGPLRRTASSQGWAIFRAVGGQQPVLAHCHWPALTLERAAYYGGRCDLRRVGIIDHKCHLVDVNSAYLTLGASLAMPTLLAGYESSISLSRLSKIAARHQVCADVTISPTQPDYPMRVAYGQRGEMRAMPPARKYLSETRGTGVIYPIGEFRTCLIGEELVHALEACVIADVHRAAWYVGSTALREPCDAILDRIGQWGRCPGSQAAMLKKWYKRVGVSLIGKFGQRSMEWVRLPDRTSWEAFALWSERNARGYMRQHMSIAGDVYVEELLPDHPDAVPAIAAAITAAQRCQLTWDMHTAGSVNWYYCDTDSLLVNDRGLARLQSTGRIEPLRFGSMKIEESADICEIYGPKWYKIGAKAANCGLAIMARWYDDDGTEMARVRCRQGFSTKIRNLALTSGGSPDMIAGVKDVSVGRLCQDGRVTPWTVSADGRPR